MRAIYAAWALGLLLKFTGAAWDVAWHFRQLREAISPPHLVNIAGDLVCIAAFAYEWRHREPHRRVPLIIMLSGMVVFGLAIPFDQFWHTVFGIDITTWSPAHLMLFGGTAISVAGLTLLFLADLRHEHGAGRGAIGRASLLERAMLIFLLVGVAEAVAFPLAYNEYTTLAVRDATADPGRLDPVIVNMVLLVPDPVFHGTPHWLYPVYSIVTAVLLATIVRAALGPGWAAVMLTGVTALRAVSNNILYATGWPDSVLPLQHMLIGLAVEAAWLLPLGTKPRVLAGGLAGATAAYLYFAFPPAALPHVPLDASSAWFGVPLALLAAWLGYLLQDKAASLMGRVPVMRWERYADRVAQWSPRE